MKKQGYETGFYFGGNASIHQTDTFLHGEHVDVVLDKNSFAKNYGSSPTSTKTNGFRV